MNGLFVGAASLSLLLAGSAAMAQDFQGPVRIIVPFAPGGTSDILARYIAPELSDAIGQPVIVENKAGAGGNIGADFVAKADPNGHTLLLSDLTALLAAPSVLQSVAYDIETDLDPVTMVSYSPYVLGVSPNHEFESFDAMVEYSRANPGELAVATSGVGANNHITTERLIQELGLDWTVIAYRGGSDATRAVVSGESDMLLNGTTASLPFVLNDQMHALAVTGEERLEELPDVPTFRELGLPGELDGTYQGILITAGSPPDITERLQAELAAILSTEELQAKIAEQGGQARPSESPDELRAWMTAQKSELESFIESAGIGQ
ncbi:MULTISPECIES: Bug family tripartite tricarboxylate transporter substrate binding protein [unclassified Halomonas]|uniref:Bug family tripartite tricarboxylate transporter substrate binding protein n=1 Tax=unclassified Halomonas TaxID=2609666 RepID=UPI0021E4C9B3|nr:MULTISPECIES: tripartite tricarboxylate transporter substrate binding protein [unclassified Halomonas]UYG00736.1 tripartite tricarboxylate transporter substrate binding protein [Halomonas sp. GD1P12]WNL38208.1 tripartite tricarboxylate transporter substrate binding protein [Halomonas sp. PAMB 3232]WNL41508.1 tripartite tricarboxylate transporter substrate binding protein [Halomonas sp. PAMB 3264]